MGSFAVAQAIAEETTVQEPKRSPFYFRLDTGPAFTQDTDVKHFLNPSRGLDVEFDTGWHLGGSGGYQFTDWLAAELQTGITAATIDRFSSGGIRVHDSSYSNIPLLANVVLQYPCHCGFTPFAGGGVGPSFSILNADDIVASGSVIDGADTDVVFAYQLFAGLRYRLNERMELGAMYKYFVADGADWDVDVFLGPDSSIEFDDTQTHIVAFTFNVRF